MIPGPDFYYRCPQCNNLIVRGSLISSDPTGARVFSDCKTIAPDHPDFPVITKCRKCSSIFWLFKLEDADLAPANVKKTAEVADFLSVDDCFLALDKGLAENTEETVYLRQRILWAFNDKYRYGNADQNNEPDERYRANITEFLKILDPDKADDVLLLAELYRYQGRFDDCIDLLTRHENDDNTHIVDAFCRECDKKNTRVFEII